MTDHLAPQDSLAGLQFFDRSMTPIDIKKFMELRSIPGYRLMKETHVGPYTVLTVWTGMDMLDAYPEEPPFIFATIAKSADGDAFLEDTEVFAQSEESYLEQHADLVNVLKAEVTH